MKRLVVLIALACISFGAFAVPVTEDFESDTVGATTFSQGGFDFSVTGDWVVEGFGNFGAGNSANWLGTGSFDGGTVASTGLIQIDTADAYFQITSFDGWTSANDGSNETAGTVEFTGIEYLTGVSYSAVIQISPTGAGGLDWDFGLTFAGTALEGKNLVSLEADLSANSLNYLALDNIAFEIGREPPDGGDVPVPASLFLLAAGMVGFQAARRRSNR